MNAFFRIVVVCLFMLASADVFATSRVYSTLDQLISRSDVIAWVTVSEPNEKNYIRRSKTQKYGFATPVKVKKRMKGDVPDTFWVHHMAARDDCLFQQDAGDYIVFLRKKENLYVPTDGWPSSKYIQDKKVAGWGDNHSWWRSCNEKSLEEVLAEIEMKTNGK